MKRTLALLLALCALCLYAPALAKSTPAPVPTPVPLSDAALYARAQQYLDGGFLVEAVNDYAQLGDYQDAKQYYAYARGLLLWSRQDAKAALELMESLGDFADAARQAERFRRLSVHRWWDAGLFGYVNLAGETVIPAAWDYVPRTFAEDTARADESGAVSPEALLYAPVYQGALVAGETESIPDPNGVGAWGVLRSDGQTALPCEYAEIGWIENGYAAVRDDSGWRVYDLEAAAFAGESYQALGALGEGSVPAQRDGLWGYVSLPSGEALGEGFVFESCLPMAEGFGAYVRDGQAGFVDATGAPAITGEYLATGSFSEGLAAVRSTRKRWGFINARGELVIKCQYRDAGRFTAGLCAVQEGDRWGVIDAQGAAVLKARYHEIGQIDAQTGRIWMRRNKLWGIANFQGEVVVKPAYSTTTGFSADRMAGVSYRGAFGYVDVRGTTFVPLEHKAATSFAAGLGAVADGDGATRYFGKFNLAFTVLSDVPLPAERGFIEGRVMQAREEAATDAEGNPAQVVTRWYEYRLYDLDGQELH